MKRQFGQEPEIEDIRLPDYLLEFRDIRGVTDNALPKYEVSKLATQYAKCHSNLEDITAAYCKMKKKSSEDIPVYLSAALAVCVSYPLKRLCKPFEKFVFNSSYHEEVCRTMLRNPGIETQQQLDDFMQFSNKHQLKFMSISMMQDNDVYADSCQFVKRHQLSQKTDKIPVYTRQGFERHIQHLYYMRQNVIQHMALANMSLEDMERITNFKKLVLAEMKCQKTSEVHYKTVARYMLQGYKDDPSLFLANQKLVIYPLYEIIVNNLTDEQQDLIASDFGKFCECVNIKQVCKSKSPRLTSEEAYRMYVGRTQIGRKLPPFHRMYWIGCDSSDSNASAGSLRPTVSATNLVYQRRPRFERNTEMVTEDIDVQAIEDESSSDTSRTTATRRPQSTPMKMSRRMAIDSPTPLEVEPGLSPVLEQSPELEAAPNVTKTPGNSNKTADVVQTPSFDESSNQPLEFTPTVYSGIVQTPGNVGAVIQTPPVYSSMPAAIPDRYLNEDLEIGDAVEITGMLMANSCFIKELKAHLKLKYPVDFDIQWATNKKLISSSFIFYCWSEDLQQLLDLLDKCNKTEANPAVEMIAEKLAAPTNFTQSKFTRLRKFREN